VPLKKHWRSLFFKRLRINALFWKVRSFEEKLNLCFHGFFKSNKISSNLEMFSFWNVRFYESDPSSSRVSVYHQNFTFCSRKQFCSFSLHRDLTIAAPETSFTPNFGIIKFQQIWNLTTPKIDM
jgi:hypothetical protein